MSPVTNMCAYCNKSDNHPTLQCDGCKTYVHYGCSQIDADDAKRITRQRTKGVKFFCSSCNKSVDQFTQLKELLQDLADRMERLEKRSPQQHDLSPQEFEMVIKEVRDRMNRECNIIIYNIPENPQTDIVTVGNILNVVSPEVDVSLSNDKISRLGKKDGNSSKPRPVRVTLPSSVIVSKILRNKNKLKNDNTHKNIFLKNDETPYQRQLLNTARDNLRRRINEGESNLTIKYVNGIPIVTEKN